MVIIYNNLLPLGRYRAVNVFGIILAKRKYGILDAVVRNHEYIHTMQQREMAYVFFYLWYMAEWLLRTLWYRDLHRAYLSISFEREAYRMERDLDYRRHRRLWAWMRFLR